MSPRGWARTDAASTGGVEQSLMERWCWGRASRPAEAGMRGEAGPLKGALSMLRGGLHVWSPRTQHPREMGVAWMRGGASRGLRHGYRPPFDGAVTQTDTRPTQRHGLHSTPRVSTHLPSADTAGLPQPAPAPPPGGPRRPGPRPPASGPCPPGRSQTGWAPRALHQVALQGLLL